MPVALQSALEELTPRTFGELMGEPEVPFDVVQENLASADRCPATCGACTQGTEDCQRTGHTIS
ncbi:hypothetical protein [Catenuloplanes japonicus]|uniref:hypothetical protein n=1 Tax=Catenuloplanes japonicus TaxID=33876 RepID=UPI00052519FD|nr:hypothetical protein [Catenuloplanes japonicus]